MGGAAAASSWARIAAVFLGCEGLVIVIVITIDSPGLLALSALPCPFVLPLHLLPLLFLPFIVAVNSHFFRFGGPFASR